MPRHTVRLTILGLLLGSLLLAGLSGRALVAQVDTEREHVVKPDETLSAISLQRGVPLERLMALNGLTDPDVLEAGQVLKLGDPSERGAAAQPSAVAGDAGGARRPAVAEYVVRDGDTLWSIARAYGVAFQALAEANQITEPDRLTVGQRILIPGATRAGPPRQPTASPTPTARPAPVVSQTAPLADRVVAAARAVAGPRGRIGVAGRDLVTGQQLAISAHEAFPAASVAKLAILTEAYRQHEAARRPLTDALKADLRRMIEVSDNDAANRLLNLLGIGKVNTTMSALGLPRTRLGNQFETAPRDAGVLNRTGPADMLRWLELLATDRLVSPTASREMRFLLSLAQDGSKLRRGLPGEAGLAHKSGWFGQVANDVGIVHHGSSAYILAVFTEGLRSPEAANDAIAAIARTVHEAWGPVDGRR